MPERWLGRLLELPGGDSAPDMLPSPQDGYPKDADQIAREAAEDYLRGQASKRTKWHVDLSGGPDYVKNLRPLPQDRSASRHSRLAEAAGRLVAKMIHFPAGRT